ncbi:uncharacterized protein LY89DRAFT_666558 [Mollisia scopiformis]|uniref:2EXR domain-containing protein n=1 Tax=Mollisia scopiformis TaxID=149040 RepID=A0A194XHT5_MOLSC|nr:uncharacterized protein LY89DRAFT_666558 [Mollisia scopiformis]KUJ19696.1 hypothetical protein LY89DRAFT_666558 [Mollisia scopiformis]
MASPNLVRNYKTLSPDSPSILQPLESFHQFPKLPNELRDIIWNYALTPQLVKLREVFVDIPRAAETVHKAVTFIKTSKNHALLCTCQASHAVAPKKYGQYKMTTLEPRRPSKEEIQAAQELASTIYFAPLVDTMYLPRFHDIFNLVSAVDITEKNFEGPPQSLSQIRSLALGGRNPSPLKHNNSTTPFDCSEANFDDDDSVRGVMLAKELFDLQNLEEVIIVTPPANGLASPRNDDSLDFTGGAIIDPKVYNKCIKWMQVELQKELNKKFKHEQHCEICNHHNSSRNLPIRSAWWKDPKVTPMSREEFRARFGQDP